MAAVKGCPLGTTGCMPILGCYCAHLAVGILNSPDPNRGFSAEIKCPNNRGISNYACYGVVECPGGPPSTTTVPFKVNSEGGNNPQVCNTAQNPSQDFTSDILNDFACSTRRKKINSM
jgi:hypothetical protein